LKVFFDANVWCRAILNPAGLDADLLDLAAQGGPLRGVTSDAVLLEFFRHATGGTLPQVYSPDDVWAYITSHDPLFEVGQAPIGRSLPDRTDLHNLPLSEIVYELTGRTRSDLLTEVGRGTTLPEFDVHDLHVLAAAVDAEADAICSDDKVFRKVDWIDICRPVELAAEFGLV
jgi:predicted nucleic acid-binding protein